MGARPCGLGKRTSLADLEHTGSALPTTCKTARSASSCCDPRQRGRALGCKSVPILLCLMAQLTQIFGLGRAWAEALLNRGQPNGKISVPSGADFF